MSVSTSAAPPRRVAIVDPCCASGYTPDALVTGGIGGTEATVLRVTGALASHADILHFQNGRDSVRTCGDCQIRPLADAFLPRADTVFVVINSWKVACKLRKAHPHLTILLWLHVHPGRHNRPMAAALAASEIGIICVSQSHEQQLRGFLGDRIALRIAHIHNPIADQLRPDQTPRDLNRLLFASSPHKGLAQVFVQFRAARAALHDLTLAVADPGYLAWDTGPVPGGVTFLGILPHDALIGEMRRALCLFYPQTGFAETFGLVLAEANAVGTPVLVHRDLGANAEVVRDAAQLVDGNDPTQILHRLRQWRAAPPVVQANPDFRLANVARRWTETLGLEQTCSNPTVKVA